MVVKLLKDIKHELYLHKVSKQRAQQARDTLASEPFASHFRALEGSFEIPALVHTEGIWAIAMVKNEADIIEASVRHMFAQGISRMLIVDNNSDDGTYDILLKLAEEFPLHVGKDTEPAYYQSEKMTWLAHHVQRAGATWVVPFDADEFWVGFDTTLAQVLESSPYAIEHAMLFNLFPQDSGAYALDIRQHIDGKVCFRSWPQSVLTMGNHSALLPGKEGYGHIAIMHVPWRSRAQLQRKLQQGAAALELADHDESLGYHWRANAHLDGQELVRLWHNLVTGGEVPESLSWRPQGELYPFDSIPTRFRPVHELRVSAGLIQE